MTVDAVGPLAADIAAAALAMARRFAGGATLWCVAGDAAPAHARHVAVEFMHPIVVGKPALPAVALPVAEAVAQLRVQSRPRDIVMAIAGGDDAVAREVVTRSRAWGVDSIWVGAGRGPPGAAGHVLWVDAADIASASVELVRLYHLLWELTHVCLEHPEALAAPIGQEEVCVTCADEGLLGEVRTPHGDEATVVIAGVEQRVQTALLGPTAPGDLVLVHAGTAIGRVETS